MREEMAYIDINGETARIVISQEVIGSYSLTCSRDYEKINEGITRMIIDLVIQPFEGQRMRREIIYRIKNLELAEKFIDNPLACEFQEKTGHSIEELITLLREKMEEDFPDIFS